MPQANIRVAAVILAGGQGLRMQGQDKGLLEVKQVPMVEWSVQLIQPLVDKLLISCNRNHEAYEAFQLPVVSDIHSGYQGPLAGIHAAMQVVAGQYSHLLVTPCDTPLLSDASIKLLLEAAHTQPEAISLLRSAGRPQFLHAIIPTDYFADLETWLDQEQRAVFKWYRRFPVREIEAEHLSDQFLNINSQQDLSQIT